MATAVRYPVEIILPEHWSDPILYRLLEEMVVGDHTIPEGFITDGATTPRLFWFLFPPVDRYFAAAALHDYLLESGWSRDYARRNFYRALKHAKVVKWRRYIMHALVWIWDQYRTYIHPHTGPVRRVSRYIQNVVKKVL